MGASLRPEDLVGQPASGADLAAVLDARFLLVEQYHRVGLLGIGGQRHVSGRAQPFGDFRSGRHGHDGGAQQ